MRVTQYTVSTLVKKVKKNPELFHELLEKKEEKLRRRDEIVEII